MSDAEDYMKNFETLMGATETSASELGEPHDGMPEPEARKRAARLMKMLREARQDRKTGTLPNYRRKATAVAA